MLLNMNSFTGDTEVLGQVRTVKWDGNVMHIDAYTLEEAKAILMALFTGKMSVSEPVRSLETCQRDVPVSPDVTSEPSCEKRAAADDSDNAQEEVVKEVEKEAPETTVKPRGQEESVPLETEEEEEEKPRKRGRPKKTASQPKKAPAPEHEPEVEDDSEEDSDDESDTSEEVVPYKITDSLIKKLNEKKKVREILGTLTDALELNTVNELLVATKQVVNDVPRLKRAEDIEQVVSRIGASIGLDEDEEGDE